MSTEAIIIKALESEDLPAFNRLCNQSGYVRGTLQLPYTSLEARRKRHGNS